MTKRTKRRTSRNSAVDAEDRIADFEQVMRVVCGESSGLVHECQQQLSRFEEEPVFTPNAKDLVWARRTAKKISALRDEIARYF